MMYPCYDCKRKCTGTRLEGCAKWVEWAVSQEFQGEDEDEDEEDE